jgi:uncharacterized protein YndB with AHSA1/START domain
MSAFEIELSGCIEAPPETTWALLSDREAVPEWLDDVAAVSGEGDRLLVQRSPAPGGEWIEGTIREAVPRERLALGLTDPSRLLSQAEVQLLLGPDDGGTAYRIKVACQARPLWSVLSPLLRLRAQVALHRAVRGFRAGVADRIAAERRRARVSRSAPIGSGLPRSTEPTLAS